MVDLPGTSIHPHIRLEATQLLAKERTNNQANELESELFGVELEFALQELGYLDGIQDGGEEEDHRVCDRDE